MTPAEFAAESVKGARIAWSRSEAGKPERLAHDTFQLCLEASLIVLAIQLERANRGIGQLL